METTQKTNEEIDATKTEPAQTEAAQPVTLEQLAKDVEKTRKYNRTQARMSVIRTAASVITLVLVCYFLISLMPKVNDVVSNANAAVSKANEVIADVEALDLEGMTSSITALAEQGTVGIGTALKDVSRALSVVEKLDIEGLNSSIQDLGTIVEPMAKLFGKK